MAKDSVAQTELGRSFHQEGQSDFVPFWDGTIMRRSLAECKLLEGRYISDSS